MSCQTTLDIAKGIVIGAAGSLAVAAGAVLVASLLNASFFGAPAAVAAMIAAAIAAGVALAALGAAAGMLNRWASDGCLARECFNTLASLNSALAVAIASVTVLLAGCLSLAGVAWIPWFAILPMAYLYAAIVASAASLYGIVKTLWGSLGECQEKVTKARGPLMAGEKASDPWFLRIKPKTPPAYERSVKSTGLADDAVNSEWLQCRLDEVHEWEVGAIAYIIGTPAPPITFMWTLAGNAVSASSVQTAGTTSTLTLKSTPLAATAKLSVTAADANGFSRTMSVDVSLSRTAMRCHLILHFVPPMYDLPKEPPGPVEITPEMDKFLQTIHAVMEASARPQG